MEIFGNYLPFVGFRTLAVDNDGDPTDVEPARHEADFFCLEWLGYGLALWRSAIRCAVYTERSCSTTDGDS